MVDYSLVSKYPFISDAKKLLEEKAGNELRWEDLEKGINRIVSVVRGRERSLSADLSLKTAHEEASLYAISRLLLFTLNNPLASRKFAEEEAKQAANLLALETEDVFFQVASDFFSSMKQENREGVITGISLGESMRIYSISLFDYLKYGGSLLYAQLEAGRVFMGKGEFLLLLKKAISYRIRDSSAMSLKSIPQMIKDAASELGERLPKLAGAISMAMYKGSYLGLECVQKILKGLPEGKRYYGSMALAIACAKDKIPKEEAVKVMATFVANCRKTTHPFTLREAISVLDWVYKRNIGFSCRMLEANDLGGEFCKVCRLKKGFGAK
ncbi:hypothetical protein HY991_02900 [Candidatus Micrarchaeota archaeon]|nr:hypothetical protein [Candidatus Micrarchaeota archaeon]